MIKFIQLFILLGFLINTQAHAQNTINLDSIANAFIRTHKLPGMGISIIKTDTSRYAIAGVKRIGATEELSSHSKFHIGSNSKAILASVAAILVEEGKIKWKSKLIEVVPDLKDKVKTAYHDITLEDFLAHRGHIHPFEDTGSKEWKKMPKDLNTLFDFAQYAMNLEPIEFKEGGGTHTYSNGGTAIAALMLERSSNKSWESLVEDYCNTLGADCHIGFPSQKDKQDTYGHKKGLVKFKAIPPHKEFDLAFLAPAGNISVSLEGLSKIIRANLTGLRGKDNTVKTTTYQKQHYGFDKYALGWYNGIIEQYDARYSYHGGSLGTFSSRIIIIPKLDIAVILLFNSDHAKNKAAETDLLKLLWKGFASY